VSDWRAVPTLVGRHVTLRPMLAEDRDAILAASADGKSWELFYTSTPGPETIDHWLARIFAEQDYGRALPLVVSQPDGRVIGATRFMRMSSHNRRLEIGGTFYAQSVRRSGVNTETKRLMLAHAFETLECLCVQFRTDWLNRTSQAAIERLGAKRDGVLRNHIVMRDGRVRDTVVYSIVAGEWPGVRANLDLLLARHEGSDK
jgi:RimJ/RimL family protein N-acetyltransferase